MLVYSPPGHGKTTLLGTAVDDDRLSPMLIIDFEAGIDSIVSKCEVFDSLKDLTAREPSLDKVDVLRIAHWSDFEGVLDFLEKHPGVYKSIALDSLSEMNYLNLNEIVEQARRTAPRHDIDIAEMQDYLRSSFQMRKLVRRLRNLDMNCFWTAGVQEAPDPLTGQSEFVPALTGKLIREIPGLVLIVGYLSIMEDENKEPHRALLTQPIGKYIAKDRSEGGKLGQYVLDPTLPAIFDLLEIAHPTETEEE